MHRPVLVGLVALAIALAAACSEPEAASTPEAAASSPTPAPQPTATATPVPSPTPTPEPVATPTPLSVSAQEVLEAAFAATQAVDALHFRTDAQIPLTVSGQSLDVPVSFAGDFKSPDSFQGTISVTIIFLTVESQIIHLGDATYLTDPRNGEWKVFEGEAPFFVGPGAIIAAAFTRFENAVMVGVETLEGVQTYLLQGTISADAFGEVVGEFQVGLWIGVEDSLLRQVKVEGEADLGEEVEQFFDSLSGLSVGADGTFSLTLKLSDFGAPVSIEPPQLGP